MASEITEFRGPWRFLSNFWACPVTISGITFPSSEHAYQAAKTLDRAKRAEVAVLATPGQAKRAGRLITIRPDWERVKKKVMLLVVIAKFTENPDLGKMLAETGDAYLEEGNDWHDNYWGACGCDQHIGSGLNWLGRILMMTRDIIRTDT